jgi:hypothetical protein
VIGSGEPRPTAVGRFDVIRIGGDGGGGRAGGGDGDRGVGAVDDGAAELRTDCFSFGSSCCCTVRSSSSSSSGTTDGTVVAGAVAAAVVSPSGLSS